MEKLIHKLDKTSRMQIATNYANDKYSKELDELNKLADLIAENLVNRYHSKHSQEDFNRLCDQMDKMNISSSFFEKGRKHFTNRKGLISQNIEYGSRSRYNRSLSVFLFLKNNIKLRVFENDTIRFCNEYSGGEYKNYLNLIDENYSDELSKYDKKARELNDKLINSHNECYELIKKVRTAELLIKHWSKAHKYLPDDITLHEPDNLTISDKFALL